MNVPPRRPLFNKKTNSNIYRVFLMVVLIATVYWTWFQLDVGALVNPFSATPTPTRTAYSYVLEADALFTAGQLEGAILAYQEATALDAGDAATWTKLARVQTYSTASLTTDKQRRERLQDALFAINQAIELSPDDANVHAIRAFVLDWNATALGGENAEDYLLQAEQAAVRALQLDNQNALAMAFYAEILIDQQKWPQAQQVIAQALVAGPELMDVHRVYAYVLESTLQYSQAIEEYLAAIEINPNLTFLYNSVGFNYRVLALKSGDELIANALYENALEYFARAVSLNEQLGILDPVPYIAIAKTYAQQGEFFIAARNIQKALALDPTNANTYGELGVIYQRSRNFEGAIPALKCAVRGCTAAEACDVRQCGDSDPRVAVVGMALSENTIVYYYTYGSLLAALSRPQDNRCPDALEVFSEVSAFTNDVTVAAIVDAGVQICNSLAVSLQETPTPVPTPTAIPTPGP